MDKIQKEFEKCIEWVKNKHIKLSKLDHVYLDPSVGIAYELFKDAINVDLLPTEKVCPDCGGDGEIMDDDLGLWVDCQTCDIKGVIQIYYTPEKYEEILGKPFSDGACVWYKYKTQWNLSIYNKIKDWIKTYGLIIFIVQTDQPVPPADYRPEE